MTPDPRAARCSVRSLQSSEPLAGTASTYRSWVLLEQPGPWGTKALRDSRLPDGLGAKLLELSAQLQMRVLLIRRHGTGATSDTARHCYVGHTGAERQVLESTRLTSLTDVLQLDFAALTRGESLGLTPEPGPLFLVCTHGKHDACCAEQGRPIAAALSARYPDATWESSHLGGDRFAGNLLCLPHGLYYGRLTPERALDVGQAYTNGQLDLASLRGRTAYPFAVQAAEIYLRRDLQLHGLDDARLLTTDTAESESVSRWRAPAGNFEVRVRVSTQPPRLLSCSDTAMSAAPLHELVAITPS